MIVIVKRLNQQQEVPYHKHENQRKNRFHFIVIFLNLKEYQNDKQILIEYSAIC